MTASTFEVKQRALREEIPTAEDLQQIANAPISHLVEAAHEVTIHKASQVFNFCAIVNAKSGRCSENCHWCAQSRHFEGQSKRLPSEEGRFLLTKCKLFYPLPLRVSSRWGYR